MFQNDKQRVSENVKAGPISLAPSGVNTSNRPETYQGLEPWIRRVPSWSNWTSPWSQSLPGLEETPSIPRS
jgi:hypothetical protein